MLRAAVEDLHHQDRTVYGVSTTAKAARTLERETGMRSDTIAKLVHEWGLPERPPDPEWRLPASTTLIVDEAGMIGTPNLHRLIELADQQHWRLALVGDPRQLQAVGRGGMFTELCNTGRAIELEHIHRFTEPWEAEASLLLRQGDPRALDLYQDHGRIRAGTLAEHLDHFATTWIANHHHGDTTALMASTNQQVDAINARVQTVRRDLGHIQDVHPVLIGDGESADIGGVVATRRNHRHLTTTAGERVRNRDLWTVTDTHDNGDLTLTPLAGHGTITLPAEYVAEHVRLGYAATEMGTQPDTVTVTGSVELASNATSCRNLYVAMTRGRRDNTVCVITDTHDTADARDILDTIIAIDRADVPATTQRRNLDTQDRQPQPVHRLQPRFEIPDWFEPLRQTTTRQLATAVENYEDDQQQTARIDNDVDNAEQRLKAARNSAAPFEQAITRTVDAYTVARECRDTLADELATTKRRDRPLLRSALTIAGDDLTHADTAQATALDAAAPARSVVSNTAAVLRAARDRQRNHRLLERLSIHPETIEYFTERLQALDTWRHWANGHTIQPDRLEHAAHTLHADAARSPQLRALRDTLPVPAAIVRAEVVPELSIG